MGQKPLTDGIFVCVYRITHTYFYSVPEFVPENIPRSFDNAFHLILRNTVDVKGCDRLPYGFRSDCCNDGLTVSPTPGKKPKTRCSPIWNKQSAYPFFRNLMCK